MLDVSRRFLASLPTAQWLPRVEWSPDLGVTWEGCDYLGGSVEADANSQVRWSAGLTIHGPTIDRERFSLFSTLVRVSLGLVFDVDDIEWCPLGTYTIGDDDVTVSRDGSLGVQGRSAEEVVIGDRFLAPRTFREQPAFGLTRQLLAESVPWAGLSWRAGLDLVVPKMIEERNRWGLIDGRTGDPSIARALGARCYADARGGFVMAPVPSLADAPVWHVTDGADGVQVELSETYSAAAVRNVWVVRGLPREEGKPGIGPVVVGDTDPSSPTRMELRRKPGFYSSPMLTGYDQCNAVAQGLLAPNLGFAQTISLTSVLNPALEVGDVIAVTMLDGTTQRHICDRITYDLEAGTMSIGGRAAATPLVGQPVDLAALYGEDVDESGADVGTDDDAA